MSVIFITQSMVPKKRVFSSQMRLGVANSDAGDRGAPQSTAKIIISVYKDPPECDGEDDDGHQ